MKKLLLPFLLIVPLSSCHTLGALLGVPAAVAEDVTGAVGAVTPDSSAVAETAGQVAATGTTVLTGNPALGAAAGALVTGIAAFFISKRRKPAA